MDQKLDTIKNWLAESAQVKHLTAEKCSAEIIAAANLIESAFREGKKLLLCGNGGSAADCQHLATEFTSRLSKDFERPGLPAIALTTDTSFLTAYPNDLSFAGVFERQVQALGNPGDVLLGISTSGRSENVLKAIHYAKANSIRTVALCGIGGPIAEQADVAICVPSNSGQHIQECHLAVEHIICHIVERALFPK